MSVFTDMISRSAAELGDAELATQRMRNEFYALLVRAYQASEKPGEICEAAGLSRQRLHQIIAKTKEPA